MKADIEDFKTGWFGVSLQLRDSDIDELMIYLNRLKADGSYHFHLFKNEESTKCPGIADFEISFQSEDEADNLAIGD